MPSQDNIYTEAFSKAGETGCLGYSRDLESNLWVRYNNFLPSPVGLLSRSHERKKGWSEQNISPTWTEKVEIPQIDWEVLSLENKVGTDFH